MWKLKPKSLATLIAFVQNKQNLYWVFYSSAYVCTLDIFQKLDVLASFKVLIVIIVLNCFVCTLAIWAFSLKIQGLFQKWSTLDPKNFYAIPFQKLVFLISFYPEFLEKHTKK